MSTSYYIYSILKYKHSALLGESLNIGILVYFPVQNRFVFKHTNNLKRVKSVYNNVSEKTIKHYFKQIDNKLNTLNENPEFFSQFEIKDALESFINKELLPIDSSVLQFDRSIQSIKYDESIDDIVDTLSKSYFFEANKSNVSNVTIETQLSKQFYKYISSKLDFEKINEQSKRFYQNYKVINDTGREYKFDYGWQNGTLNLVRSLSFDLKTSSSIENKAHQTLGLFIDLQNEAEAQNLRYDLLVAKPKLKELFKDYDHALKLLETPKRLKVIEEKEIESYSRKAIDALTLF